MNYTQVRDSINLKKNLISAVGQKMHYNQPFLQGTDCTSSAFLREISYKVNLTGNQISFTPLFLELYKVVDTCYVNAQMDFCPILLKITNKVLLKELECDYLLQVWSKEGKMVYQRHLKNPVNVWGMSYQYFIYKPQLMDDNYDCYHITDLKNGNSTLLIKDPINNSSFNHLAFYDNILYIANNQEVFLLQADMALTPGEQKKVELPPNLIRKIVPGAPIHALFNVKISVSRFYWKTPVVVAMETLDNQIDFSQIIPQNFGTPDFEYILKQQRDIVQRDVKLDPIEKFTYIVDEDNIFYGISLRKTGLFDIYWNMTLVDSPPKDQATDIDMSFDTIYLKMQDGSIKCISTDAGPSVNFEQSTDEGEEFEFPIIFYQNIKNHVNLYNSFTLVRTTLYIVHGSFVSLYNIQENQWIRHCKFYEGRVAKLLEKNIDKSATEKIHEISILLETGSIYDNMKSVFFTSQEDMVQGKLMGIDTSHRTYQIPGKILRYAQDQQENSWFYIMAREDDPETKQQTIRLYALHNNTLYELTISSGLIKEVDAFTNFIHLFSPSQKSYLVLQKDSDIQLYEMTIEKAVLNQLDEDQFYDGPPDFVKLTCIYNTTIPGIEGDIHSCISLDINDHVFFVDQKHFYKYQCFTKQTKIYKDQNCVGLYVVDDKFCYTLSHSSHGRNSGLRLYDINNILKKDTDVSYKLSNVQVGFSGYLDWNQDYFRFSILKSLDTLIIIPALHRNTIAFIGMGQREIYLATKQIKDKFIALDDKNYIFTWSSVTGKLLSVHKLPTRQDFSNFKIFMSPKDKPDTCPYQREWYQKVLLVKKEAEKNFDETAFYDEAGAAPRIKNQQLFGQTQKREFREYRLIEIVNEAEVKEHLVFIHPYYTNEKQRIYFDDKNEYMLEKLAHPRVFLYEREETKLRRQTRWKCIRRMNKFPEQLENDSGFLRTFSPDFKYYIDINRRINQFVIKDTLTMEDQFRIPKHIMNLDLEPPHIIMNRFKWISGIQYKIINKEGIEQLVDLRKGQKILQYNTVPIFESKLLKDPLRSYYTNRSPLGVSLVKDRLIRKYQIYKSAYYLDNVRDPATMYESLFSIDYQVGDCKDMHVADLSFTFLHWKIMEQLENKTLSIELIDNQQIELLFYNILPGGNTILHKLLANSEVIKKIMIIAHPDEENVSKIAIHVPFLQNLEQKSPMHLCKEQQDIRTMDTMLTYLAGYGVDHHSRAIIDIVPFCIEKQLPSLLAYLDSRLQQTDQISKINKGCLKDPSKAITEISLCFGMDEFDQKLMKQRIEGDDTIIDRPIRVEFVDIPNVYHYDDPLCDEFFGQLADTDQYEVFERKAVQKLIEFNYPLVKAWTIRKLQIPFMCFQISLFFYLNFIFGYDNIIATTVNFPMQIVLGCFACYFLRNEIQQMKDDGIAYFSSIWNYIDMITPSTVLTVLLINSLQLDIGEEYERILQAIGVFFMWFKFLYFFRIFKSFGYLIRLIILVIADMKDFLIVLFFTIVAFSDTFLTISNGNNEGATTEPFVSGFFDAIIYVYLIILGSFELSDFQNSIAASLLIGFFIMCTLFNTIVMLNLLIAIISETFSQFKENSLSATYQEMSAMIAENSYLIPDRIKTKYAEKNKYLMVVTDLEAEMEENRDEVLLRLDQLKRNLLSKLDKMNKTVDGIKKKKKKQFEWQEKQEIYNNMIIQMLQKVPGTNIPNQLDTPRSQQAQLMSQRLTMPLSKTRPLSTTHRPPAKKDEPNEQSVKNAFKLLAETLRKMRDEGKL